MESVRPYKKQVMPSLKPENFNYFLLVAFKNLLQEGLFEHDHTT